MACRSRLDAAVDVDAVLDAIERDKKRTAEGVGFVLLARARASRAGAELVEPDRVRAGRGGAASR